MKLEPYSQNVRRALLAYIGDTLSSQEREEFDRLILGDEDFSRQVEEMEFSLTEDYADDTLPADERAIVERWISGSPRRRDQVAVSAALRENARHLVAELVSKMLRTSKRGFWPVWLWGFAATAGIFAVLALSLFHHKKPTGPVVAELNRPPLVKARPAGEDTILLEARHLRGSGIDSTTSVTYTLHPGMGTRIQILVPQASASAVYSIDLHQAAPGGMPVPIHLTRLKAGQTNSLRYVAFSLPPGSLPPGAYAGNLHSAQESYSLHFSIAYAEMEPGSTEKSSK